MLVQVIHGSTIHSYRNSLSLNKMKEFIRITFPRVRDYQIVHTITNTVV